MFLCAKAFTNACAYPGSRSFIGRKRFEDFKISTRQTWDEIVPTTSYKENKQDKTFKVRVGNKYSTIFYGGLNDGTGKFNKFLSSEYNFVYIDQAEELTEQDFVDVISRTRHKLPDGTVPRKMYFTANPRNSPFRARFIMAPKAGVQRFIPALPTDNPYLDPNYVPNMMELLKNRPEQIEAFLKGNWDVVEDIDQVFKQGWIDACSQITDVRRFMNKKGVSCDPARFGDDETAIYGWHGTKQLFKEIFGKKDEMHVAGQCMAMLRKVGGNWIAVGGGAIGEAVRAKLRTLIDGDVSLIDVDEGTTADAKSKFVNKRAEMYWEAQELMCETAVSLIPDSDLSKQLLAHTYHYTGGRIIIDPKDEVKLKINRSPDHADATVIGLWAMKRAPDMPSFNEIRETSTQKAIRENMGRSTEVKSYFDNEE